jgi:hypothetical protein
MSLGPWPSAPQSEQIAEALEDLADLSGVGLSGLAPRGLCDTGQGVGVGLLAEGDAEVS